MCLQGLVVFVYVELTCVHGWTSRFTTKLTSVLNRQVHCVLDVLNRKVNYVPVVLNREVLLR